MSKADLPKQRVISAISRYGLALLCVTAAVLFTKLLGRFIDTTTLFFAAVIVSAWFGGKGPGLLAVLLATLAIDYYFVTPLYTLTVDATKALRLIIFALSSLLISSVSAARKRAEASLRDARTELETEVQERTAALQRANEELQAEVAERRRAEAALRERVNLLDLTHDTVFVRDMNDVITYWNRGAAELYGWTSEEAVGQVSHQLTQTIFPTPLAEITRELLDTGRWEGELIHTKRDGTQVVVASRWALQRDEQGNPIAVLETNNDITARRQAEERLRESEEQWRAVFENNPTMYFMADAAGTVLSVNPFGAEQLGYTVDELVGHPVLNVFYEADREAVQRNVAACLAHPGRTMSWEFRKVRKDGRVLWVRETAKALLMKNRPVVLIVCEDITERKRAEEELEKTEQRLRAVIANAPIILFALDRSGVFTLSEGRGLDALGLKPGQVVGQSVYDVYRDVPQVLSDVRRALAGASFTEIVEVNDLVYQTHYVPLFNEQGEVAGVNGVAINITERKRAEESLRESERRYRYIFETAGVSIWEEDFSAVQAAIDELKARGVHDFSQYTAAHPGFVRRAITMVKVIDINEATVKLFGAQSKDELLASLHNFFLPETEEVFAGELVAIAEGRTFFESETVLQTLKGDKLTVLLTITFPPPPARLDSVLVSIMDITERKRAEEALRKAQQELAHVARAITLGEMAASIAHEINQPLAAVITNSNACLRWLAASPPDLNEARAALERIIRDGNRASEVIKRIRALLKKATPQKTRLDINEVVREAIALIRSEVTRNQVRLQTELAPDLPPVSGDRVQLQQVILNLMMNGIEAMNKITHRPRQMCVRTQRDRSGEALVAVRDSGVGLDPQNMNRLFNSFFTTKPEGMGMGLSISRSIIEAHGGRLWATPNQDYGATFHFTLPAGVECEL